MMSSKQTTQINKHNKSNSGPNRGGHSAGGGKQQPVMSGPTDVDTSDRMNMRQRKPEAEGVYTNPRLMHAMTSMVGSVVRVVTKDGTVFEGVLRTFSPKFEICLDAVIRVEPDSKGEGNNIGSLLNSLSSKHEMSDSMIFEVQNIVTLYVVNVDLEYASKGSNFVTDTQISGRGSLSEPRQLQVWEGDEDIITPLEPNGNVSSEVTWDPEEMFKVNIGLGVKSSNMGEDLPAVYSIPLVEDNSEEGRRKRMEAERIAAQIERSTVSKRNADLENADDRTEEEKYSSVVRQNSSQNQKPPMNYSDASQKNIGRQSSHPSETSSNWRGEKTIRNPQVAPQKTNQVAPVPKGASPQQTGGGPPQNAASGYQKRTAQNRSPLTPVDNRQQQQMQQQNRGGPAVPKHGPREPDRQQQLQQQHQQQTSPSTPPSFPVDDFNRLSINDVNKKADGDKPRKFSEVLNSPDPKSQQVIHQQQVHQAVPPVPPQVTPVTPIASSPSGDQKEQNKQQQQQLTATPPDEKENLIKNSKLNPNAKIFTLNPAAKPFTPGKVAATVSPPHPQPQMIHQQQHQMQPQMAPVQHMQQPQQHQPQPPHPQQQQQQQQMVPVHQNQHLQRMTSPVIVTQPMGPGAHPMFIPNGMQPYIINPGPVSHPQHFAPQNHQRMPINNRPPKPERHPSQYPMHRPNFDSGHNNPVAAATGHPVLASGPLAPGTIHFNQHNQPPGPPNGTQMFQPMYPMQSFNPRFMSPQQHMVYDSGAQHTVHYLPVQMGPLMGHPVPQSGGPQHHSNPPTPHSHTQSPSGIHGGSSTPTPQPQTVMFQGMPPQALPPHSGGGNPYPQGPMVLMSHHPGSGMPGAQGPPHLPMQMQPVMNSSATPLVNPGQQMQHYQQQQQSQQPRADRCSIIA